MTISADAAPGALGVERGLALDRPVEQSRAAVCIEPMIARLRSVMAADLERREQVG